MSNMKQKSGEMIPNILQPILASEVRFPVVCDGIGREWAIHL